MLASKPQVVVLNKIDLAHVSDGSDLIMENLLGAMSHKRLLSMSAAGRIGVDEVVARTYNFLRKLKADAKAIKESNEEERLLSISNQLIPELINDD